MQIDLRRDEGFTIVELLIVVVVIAILAAITIVSYNGIQRRAQNTVVLNSVSNWEKSIRLYQATGNSKMPDDWTCLGMSVNDFPADPAYSLGTGMCERGMIVNDSWTSEFKTTPPQPTKPTSTPDLLRQNSSPGSGAMQPLVSGTKIIKGIIYAAVSSQTDVAHPGAYLFYALNGQACPSGEAHAIHGSVNVCARPLTPPGTAWIDAIDV